MDDREEWRVKGEGERERGGENSEVSSWEMMVNWLFSMSHNFGTDGFEFCCCFISFLTIVHYMYGLFFTSIYFITWEHLVYPYFPNLLYLPMRKGACNAIAGHFLYQISPPTTRY